MLLPVKDVATSKQLSEYFNVNLDTLNSCILENKVELESNGMKVLKDVEFKSFKTDVLNQHGSDDTKNIFHRVSSLRIFNRRAILNVAMLLRDSEVAQEIRKYLLDIEHDTSIQAPEIIVNKLNELSEEKQLFLERLEAEFDGDWDKVCVINAKLFAIKNKRIKELEVEKEIYYFEFLFNVKRKQRFRIG